MLYCFNKIWHIDSLWHIDTFWSFEYQWKLDRLELQNLTIDWQYLLQNQSNHARNFDLWWLLHCIIKSRTCSAIRAYPTSWLINSNVSPRSGLKGFQNLQQKWNTVLILCWRSQPRHKLSSTYLSNTVEYVELAKAATWASRTKEFLQTVK